MAKNRTYKLHVVEQGKGAPVILIHGVLSTHRYWTPVADFLKSRRSLFMPDLLGFGASPKPHRAEYSVGQFADCLDYTFRGYHFKKRPILAGHSMGANIALRWALQRPDMFGGLVLSSPLLFEESKFHQQAATIPLEGRWLANKALARTVTFATGLAGMIPISIASRFAHGRPRYVVEDVTNQRFFVFRKLLKNAYFSDDVLEEVRRIKLPTRILIGDKDLIANHAIKELEETCKKNRFCSVRVLPGSHQVLLEHPETVAHVIESL